MDSFSLFSWWWILVLLVVLWVAIDLWMLKRDALIDELVVDDSCNAAKVDDDTLSCVDTEVLDSVIADLGLEYAENITRALIVLEVQRRGHSDIIADAVADRLGY